MKRTVIVLIVLVAALALLGCGNGGSASAPAAAAPAAQAAPQVNIAQMAMDYLVNVPGNKHIVQPNDIMDRLLAGEELYLVDIRRADDYNQGHLRGAVNIPWGTPAIYEMIKHLPTDRTVYTYCYTGQTCGQYVPLLHLAGIDARTINLGWNRALSRHDRIAEVTSTTATPIDTGVVNEIPAALNSAIVDYFQEMATRNGTPFANNIVAVDAAKAIFDANDPDVLFICQRRPADFAEAHIPGSVSMPYDETFPDNIASIPSEKRLILYCYTGQGCGQTVAMLRLMGYDAFSLNSGMGTPGTMPVGWKNQGFPVVAAN